MIVADNELPDAVKQDFIELEFSYDHPTVATVGHPGPNAVETLGGSTDQSTNSPGKHHN